MAYAVTRRVLRHAVMLALVVGGFTGISPANSAAANTSAPINPDVLTISGRFGLPKADHLITRQRLRVAAITVEPDALASLPYDQGSFKFALEQALIKSLVNHGLLARPDEPGQINLQVELPAFVYTVEADAAGKPGSTSAIALLRVTTDSTDPLIVACVTSVGRGEFKALHRMKSGGGKRATGIIAGVLIAAINPYAINTFTPQSFSNADLENQTLNANRTVSHNEGVSPGFDTTSNRSYAATNALQLAVYNYLYNQLTNNPACKAVPPVSSPETVIADPANTSSVILKPEPESQPEAPPLAAPENTPIASPTTPTV